MASWLTGSTRGVAFVATALTVAGCTGTMPSPVGMTAAPAVSVMYNQAAPFSVGIVPDRAPPVRIGEELSFTLSSSAAGYGQLYLITASGAVLVLAENLPLAANAQVAFPPSGSAFRFRAQPPAGVERMLFLATRQPFVGFGGAATAVGPIQIASEAHAFIHRLNIATEQLPHRGWALAETRIEIVNAGG